ncbi:MAG: glycosyltransferase [Anaerolineales bacterium]|nr:glycosyltransferase [Anaerolineales bacterium]
MRIGMVTACYKPVVNGVTRMVSLYKERLTALGHDVTVFTLGEPDPAGDEAGVVRSPGIPLGETGYYLGFRYRQEAQARLRQMDILHCHHLMMSVELAYRYGQCPIVYTNHTRYDLYTGAYTPLPQQTADAIMRQIWPELTDLCDVVIAPSASLRDVMASFGVRRPIAVIENGVELALFRQPPRPLRREDLGLPDGPVLIFVGRLAEEKNISTLLRQFAIARESSPAASLLIIGDGPQRAHLQEEARALGLVEAVHFAGTIPYAAIPNYLAAADLFVTASVSEVHPLTVIEAMAAGLPVVAVASPGIAETVVSGVSGLLTQYAEGGLAVGMSTLMLDAEKRRQMGRSAQEASRRFDIDRTVRRTLDLYDDVRRQYHDSPRQRNRRNWQTQIEQLGQLLHPAPPRHHGERHDGG